MVKVSSSVREYVFPNFLGGGYTKVEFKMIFRDHNLHTLGRFTLGFKFVTFCTFVISIHWLSNSSSYAINSRLHQLALTKSEIVPVPLFLLDLNQTQYNVVWWIYRVAMPEYSTNGDSPCYPSEIPAFS